MKNILNCTAHSANDEPKKIFLNMHERRRADCQGSGVKGRVYKAVVRPAVTYGLVAGSKMLRFSLGVEMVWTCAENG